MKIISLSDLHTPHPHVPALTMLHNIKLWLGENKERLEAADMFVIPGDFWDRRISFKTEEARVSILIGLQIFEACAQHNLIFRILEGTLTHDWGQSAIFEVYKEAFPTVDYEYVAHLSIEHIKQFDMDILYIPDDITSTRQEVEHLVSEALVKQGIDKVDITIMHGLFPHQLPAGLGIEFNDPVFYTSITRYLILVGHIHQFAHEGIIVTPSSFERLAHHEEDDKGGVFIEVSNRLKVTRLINRNTTLFNTVDFTTLSNFDRYMSAFDDKAMHIALKGERDTIKRVLPALKQSYPHVTFKVHAKATTDPVIPIKEIVVWNKFTDKTITSLIEKELANDSEQESILKRLKEALDEVTP